MSERTFEALSMTELGLSSFEVSGGRLASSQKMGWHVIDDKGFTVAVSPDADFCELVKDINRSRANVQYVEHVDEDGTPHQAVYINGERVTRDRCTLEADDLLLVLNRLGDIYRFNLKVQRSSANDVIDVSE